MSQSASDVTVQQIEVTRLIPYWRNPRNNEKAIEKVADSIRKYGFQQPILVDADMTIVAGHTRYAAARTLGMDTVPVVITDLTGEQAKAYRIADNRTSEYAAWDTDELLLELKSFSDPEFLDLFFPHIDLTTDFANTPAPITQEDVDKASGKITDGFSGADEARRAEQTLVIPCPHCYEDITLNKSDIDSARWVEA